MYVVMSATGNIGSKLANILLDKGEKVRVIGRSSERLTPFVAQGAEAAVGDVSDAAFLTNTFKDADAVFALIPPNYAADDFRAEYNAVGDNIAKAIQESGVKHVLFVSSVGAELPEKTGKPDLQYVQFSAEDSKKGMMDSGMSADVSDQLPELGQAINDGLIAVNQSRTAENTTSTSIEEFADFFAQVYESSMIRLLRSS